MKRRAVVLSILTVILCAVALSMSVEGNTQRKSPTRNEDIEKLLELTGAGKLGIQVMNQMIPVFKQGNPGIPDKFWKDFMAEVNAKELVEMVIPIYGKYLSHDEVKQLIKFYDTPVGKKLIEVQPKIMLESMIAGQKWGQQLGEKIAEKLKEQRYK